MRLPPETAHGLAARMIACTPDLRAPAEPRLATPLAGHMLPHPVGLAAGFDKSAHMLHGLGRLGFAFVEAGTVTPRPQAGNPKPRLFRLARDEALINRFGFNNDGLELFVQRFAERPKDILSGANIGINKDCAEPFADFGLCLRQCAAVADFVTINVSSPNTPGLRDLQDPASLRRLLDYLATHESVEKPIFLKLAPDLPDAQLLELVHVAIEARLSGLILCNTTIGRPEGLLSPDQGEGGGLSGRPVRERSKEMLRLVAGINQGRLQLVSVGGLADGQDLFERLQAGAHAVQIYTSFIYQGPFVIERLCRELLAAMDKAGVPDMQALIGRAIAPA